MRAYIDESGAPGTKRRGSRWLVFGCVMVADGDVQEMQSGVQDVRNRLNPQRASYIHFKNISHDDKVGALNLMATMPWTGIVVASDTTKTPISDPRLFYDVTAVYVVERALAYARELREDASIYFEDSGNFQVQELESLVQLASRFQTALTRGQPETSSHSTEPYDIRGIVKGDAHGLDIADGLAHASFRALEPNRKWGHFEPAYLNILSPRLWKGASETGLEGWGLNLIPTEMAGNFREEYPWIP